MGQARSISWTTTATLVVIAVLCLSFFYVPLAWDQASRGSSFDPLSVFVSMDPGSVASTVGNMGQVIAAILGVAITVVSIVLQLAATRYTPKVTDLFFRSPVNLGVMTIFVVGAFQAMWVGFSVRPEFVPRAGMAVAVLFMSASLVLLIPYFAYVFHFLRPDTIIARIGSEVTGSLGNLGTKSVSRRSRTFADIVTSIEQLSEIALNAIENRDKTIAIRAIETLREVAVRHQVGKKETPLSHGDGRSLFSRDPDLVSMPDEMIEGLFRNQVWLEMKVLRQFQMLFDNALGRLADVNYYIAMQTREIGARAIETGDEPVVGICVRFFNTYLRASVNANSVRTAYNVLNQYRMMGERLVDAGDADRVREVVGYFKYYGMLSFNRKLTFILETAAYDICALLMKIRDAGLPNEREILGIFLQVDREYEGEEKAYEESLRGVRKAQVKLATFYLANGSEDLARVIFEDMRNESRQRLDSIQQEMHAVKEKYYWEIIDRGVNLDYLPPGHREHLDRFFGWFEQGRAAPPVTR